MVSKRPTRIYAEEGAELSTAQQVPQDSLVEPVTELVESSSSSSSGRSSLDDPAMLPLDMELADMSGLEAELSQRFGREGWHSSLPFMTRANFFKPSC
jgi:hypothetical protein